MPAGATLGAAVLRGLLGLWLVGAVVNSTMRGHRWLRGRWFSYLVPRWNFFAPRPGTRDYHLVYRDQFPGGGVSTWREVPGFYEDRGLGAAVWNPAKFHEKALYDLAQELVVHGAAVDDEPAASDDHGLREVDSDSVKLTTPYIAILNVVASQDRSDLSVATQFAILRSDDRGGDAEPVFLSDVHGL